MNESRQFDFRLKEQVVVLVQYPDLEPLLDEMLPKKSPLIVAKWWVTNLAFFCLSFRQSNSWSCIILGNFGSCSRTLYIVLFLNSLSPLWSKDCRLNFAIAIEGDGLVDRLVWRVLWLGVILLWCWDSQNHINLVVVNNVPLFFNVRDGPYMPTLRLLHQCTPRLLRLQSLQDTLLSGSSHQFPGMCSLLVFSNFNSYI